MARTKSATAPTPIDAVVNNDALTSASTALTQVSHQVHAAAEAFGITTFDVHQLKLEVKALVQQTGRTLFEIGGRLCALRAAMPSDDWKGMLEELQMSPRSANRLMQSALKCVDASGAARERLMALPQAKVLELLTLDEDKLTELETTGGIDQLALQFDEIDRMSASELRAKLREAQQAAKAKDKVIAKKSAELDKLHEQRAALSTEDEAQRIENELVQQLRDLTTAAEIALSQLCAAVGDAITERDYSERVTTASRTSVEYVAQHLAEQIATFGIPVQFEEMVKPEWLTPVATTKSKGRKG